MFQNFLVSSDSSDVALCGHPDCQSIVNFIARETVETIDIITSGLKAWNLYFIEMKSSTSKLVPLRVFVAQLTLTGPKEIKDQLVNWISWIPSCPREI